MRQFYVVIEGCKNSKCMIKRLDLLLSFWVKALVLSIKLSQKKKLITDC